MRRIDFDGDLRENRLAVQDTRARLTAPWSEVGSQEEPGVEAEVRVEDESQGLGQALL